MVAIKRKIADLFKKTNLVNEINLNKFMFNFVFGLKNNAEQFKVNLGAKCLVFSQYPGAEIKGAGGLIAQYPKNFEILCLTNGSNMIEGNPVESASIKKQEFQDVMRMMRIKGYKIFDINSDTLKNHYSTFKKIDISEADYIFVPNVYDANIDTIALLKHFKQILKDKEIKQDLRIFMYESDYALSILDFYADISSIIETKKKLMRIYYPEDKYPGYTERNIGINAYRAIQYNCNYVEAFMSFTVEEFLKIPLI